MSWMSQRFLVPILIGVSLTGVSVGLIYLLCKQDEESSEKSKKKGTVHPPQTEKKCMVPRQFVPAVIGRGGSTIKGIQEKTGTRLHFVDDDIECPDRICIIRGSVEAVCLADAMIKNIISNQPVIENYELFVPRKAYWRIIGNRGETVMQIQMITSTKIIVENPRFTGNPNADIRVIIKGTAEHIAAAVSQIEDKVREENEACQQLEANHPSRQPRGKLSPRNTAVDSPKNASESTCAKETLTVQGTDTPMKIYVSAMETPSQFWVQIVKPDIASLDKLVTEMTDYYNNEENRELHVLDHVTEGQMVAAKFSYDQRWYRAEVMSLLKDNFCTVYFVDYGDHEDVELANILELRIDFLALRTQAMECSLANVKARDNEWSNEACDRFAELTWLAQWKPLDIKVRGYKERAVDCGVSRRAGSPIPCVDLYDKNDNKNIDVGKELVNEGFAEYMEDLGSSASSTLSLSRRSHDVSAPTSVSSPPAKSETRHKDIPVLDLVTPKKSSKPIEEIDLVTPVKDETNRFINNEKKVLLENGSGDHLRNGSTGKSHNSSWKVDLSSGIVPGGYESDLSDDTDLELG